MKGQNDISTEKSSFMRTVEKYHGRSIHSAMHIGDEGHHSKSGNGGFKGTHLVFVCI